MFNNDAVLPVVAEVICVMQWGDAALDKFAKPHTLGLMDLVLPDYIF